MNKFKLALCQINVVDDKKANIKKAVEMIAISAQNGANIVVLPEMFNCPYDNSKFKEYAEIRDKSKTLDAISKAAKDNNVTIIAGSIPELDNNELFNSCFIFDDDGEIIGNYRKMHLFDIDTEEIRFKESDVLNAGNSIEVFDTKFARIGVAICYDMRFPELIRIMTLKKSDLIIIPGAFNMITGPAHWELLIRSRAVDNQLFVAAASPARNENLSYVAYGNSMIVDPWGNICSRAGEKEEIIYAYINLDKIQKVRRELPLIKNRRNDIYQIVEKNIN
ncbi:carbon-nitrogen hydrolase family protein [Methanobacterium sp. ACI-7]|uniref:carbon-nitrogen hydrolase family protein n=1 Tax=unclassified Methanobacterium TaxID=2627676 RepID=UPI0039C1D8CD